MPALSEAPGPSVSFGPGCDRLPQGEAPGSPATMARQPTLAAIATNPLLTEFATAFRSPGISAKLNGRRPVTVFAPTNEAMQAFRQYIGDSAYRSLTGHEQSLVSFARHAMVEQALDRSELAGTLTALDGEELTVAPAGDTLTVTDRGGRRATVVCGNIATSNGRLYITDNVLVSPSSQFSQPAPPKSAVRCAPNPGALNNLPLCLSPSTTGTP